MGVFDALQKVADTAGGQPDPNADAAHATYHRRIVGVGGCFAAAGAVLGLVISVVMAGEAKSGRDIKGVILMPVMMGLGGFMFGMAVMCLVAPRAFLTGPVGRPWMALIGTQSVTVARVACFLFGLFVSLVAVGFGFAIALDARRG